VVFIFSEINSMTLIEWRDEFKIGIKEVDFEHQELIELINELYGEAINKGSTLAVMDCLEEIFSKISAHFALEEKVMKEMKYDQYQDHKEDHERLLDSLQNIMDKYTESLELDETKLANQLHDWFVAHFSSKDARMHQFIHH